MFRLRQYIDLVGMKMTGNGPFLVIRDAFQKSLDFLILGTLVTSDALSDPRNNNNRTKLQTIRLQFNFKQYVHYCNWFFVDRSISRSTPPKVVTNPTRVFGMDEQGFNRILGIKEIQPTPILQRLSSLKSLTIDGCIIDAGDLKELIVAAPLLNDIYGIDIGQFDNDDIYDWNRLVISSLIDLALFSLPFQ
jgi:hypothetical protein